MSLFLRKLLKTIVTTLQQWSCHFLVASTMKPIKRQIIKNMHFQLLISMLFQCHITKSAIASNSNIKNQPSPLYTWAFAPASACNICWTNCWCPVSAVPDAGLAFSLGMEVGAVVPGGMPVLPNPAIPALKLHRRKETFKYLYLSTIIYKSTKKLVRKMNTNGN